MEQYKDSILIPLELIDTEDRITASRSDVTLDDITELADAIHEDGLLQPIVVEDLANGRYKLCAGGRRFAAYTLLAGNKVGEEEGLDYTKIPARVFHNLTHSQRIKIEWEENNRRLNPDWKMNCLHVLAYHKACVRESNKSGEKWTQEATGQVMGYAQGSISALMLVARELASENPLVVQAETFKDAVKNLLGRQAEVAQKELIERAKKRREQTIQKVESSSNPSSAMLPKVSTVEISSLMGDKKEAPSDSPVSKPEDFLPFYYEGNCLELLPKIHAEFGINHIITDPPYAIDMDNFVSESIENVRDTHDVSQNLELIPEFLRVSFDCIREDGFLCMWYDLDHHEKIAEWAKKIGWRVQRWPFTWLKTSPCRNSQAQYNFTKSTEVCYIMRRSEKSVLRKKQQNNYQLAASASTPSHPFVKPFAIWQTLIEAVSAEGQNVFDGFAGEGSMLAASLALKRNPFGVEIDQKHIASGIHYIHGQLQKNNSDAFFSEPLL